MENENQDWKGKTLMGFLYVLGVPVTLLASAIMGGIIMAFVWGISNTVFGVGTWVISGTAVEILPWNPIWTRATWVVMIIVALIMFSKLYGDLGTNTIKRRRRYLKWIGRRYGIF